jgi:hypothetical protein
MEVSLDGESVALECRRTLDVGMNRGKDDASIPGIRDGPPGKYERRLSHLGIELLRSCGDTYVSSGRIAEVGDAHPYEAVKSNPTPSSSSRMDAPFSACCSRLDLVSENSVENGQNYEGHRGCKDYVPQPTRSRCGVVPVHSEFLTTTPRSS